MKENEDHFSSLSDFDLAEEIIDFAREYRSESFPNSDCIGCPTHPTLVAVARSGELPDPEIREHLLFCSPCFNEFRTARDSAATPATTAARSSWAFWPLSAVAEIRYPLGLAVTAGAVLVAFAMLSYLIVLDSKPELAKATTTGQTGGISPFSNTVVDDVNRPDVRLKQNSVDSVSQKSPAAEAKNEVTGRGKTSLNRTTDRSYELRVIDATVLRSGSSAAEAVYTLPAKKINLEVKLPEGSRRGKYEVSLRDEFGKPQIANQTVKSNGKSLAVKLDLGGRRGPVRLCVAPDGEIPDCFSIEVTPTN
ncbi:MAG: hypothetical protein IPJ30_09450 [Acidobacteria bacterium]|nr:hypothetical protein [Acidobacteriota bacterium]